jgi:hypothetical protein
MNEKLQESVQYLRYCNIIENEAFRLYETLSKKINQPESSFVVGLAYDSLKNTKVIQGILDYFDLSDIENKNGKKNLAELATETMILSKKISKINSLDYLISCEMLKESANLEDLLSEIYTNYLQSSAAKTIVEELSKLVTVNLDNFKKVFENFVEEKARHRGTLIEVIYSLEAKETETHRQITPLVKYQNPDAWIHESTIHSFSNTPITGNTQQ